MADISRKLVHLFVIVQILIQCITEPKKGTGKAVGAAILGGLGVAAVGHILTRQNSPAEQHHYHHYPSDDTRAGVPSPVPQARPPMIIERGETLPNGCYKQTIKEPDMYDSTRFIETEQLICPPSVPAPPAYTQPAAVMPQQPQPVVPAYNVVQVQPVVPIQPMAPSHPIVPIQPMAPSHPIVPEPPTVVEPAPQPPNINDSSQFPPLVPVHTVPLAPLVPGYHLPQPPAVAPAPITPVGTYVPQPAVVQPQQPAVAGPPSNSATSQVIVLSKKTGLYADDKKKNNANTLLKTNFIVMLLMISFLHLL